MTTHDLNQRGWFMDKFDQDVCRHKDGRILDRKTDRRWHLGNTKLYSSLGDSVIEADKRKANSPVKVKA